MQVWAIRESLAELALGRAVATLPLHTYYTLTYALLAAAFGLSTICRSVYVVVSLVGSTACVTFSYVFPGLLLWRLGETPSQRAGGGAAIALAGAMAALAVGNFVSGSGLEAASGGLELF